MYSFSANSKGEEALLHPQNSYLLVIQKKNEQMGRNNFGKKLGLLNKEEEKQKEKKQRFKRRKAAL